MTDELETPPFECDRCGRVYGGIMFYRSHRRVCESDGGAYADADTCPMCGAKYDSYTDHIAEECEPR